jgi:hypothetical protein
MNPTYIAHYDNNIMLIDPPPLQQLITMLDKLATAKDQPSSTV